MPRAVLDDTEELPPLAGGNYFVEQRSPLEFIPSGATVLDCVLGGGWPLGRIANIVGDSSTGKCGNFYFLSEDGLYHTDDFGADAPVGASALNKHLALDGTKSVLATHFYKERVSKTFHVETEHGFEINGTPDHKILVITPDLTLVERRVEDVKVGDYAVIAPGSIFPAEEVTLSFVGSVGVRTSEQMVLPATLNSDLASLLGFFVADGTLSSGGAVITASKAWKMAIIPKIAARALSVNPRYARGGFHFSNQVREVLPYLFGVKSLEGCTARYKHVPALVMRSTREVQGAFLSALLSCDSGVTSSNLIYCTASRRLAREVQMMLLNFGVVATFRTRLVELKTWDAPREYFHLSVAGSRYDALIREIGLLRHVKKVPSTSTKSSYLSVPYAVDYLRRAVIRVREDLGWAPNGKTLGGTRFPKTRLFVGSPRSMSRAAFARTVDILGDLLPTDVAQTCARVVSSALVFERVIHVTEDNTERWVYDVHVPDGHLFWSSGFISHNTLLAIEGAANFVRKWPRGRVFYRESESAFDDSYAEALGMPIDRVERVEPGSMLTVEEFYDDLCACAASVRKQGVPALYFLDSLDALSDKVEMGADFDEKSYNMTKQKQLGKLFRLCTAEVARARMCLIIISQTRANIGSMFTEKRRSGGDSLNFYSSQVLWLSHLGDITKTRSKVKRSVGIRVKAKMTKSKIALPHRTCEFVITYGHGIDSLASSIDFLDEVGYLDDVAGVARDTYNKRLLAMSDDEYWDEDARVASETRRVWREVEQRFMDEVRVKRR